MASSERTFSCTVVDNSKESTEYTNLTAEQFRLLLRTVLVQRAGDIKYGEKITVTVNNLHDELITIWYHQHGDERVETNLETVRTFYCDGTLQRDVGVQTHEFMTSTHNLSIDDFSHEVLFRISRVCAQSPGQDNFFNFNHIQGWVDPHIQEDVSRAVYCTITIKSQPESTSVSSS